MKHRAEISVASEDGGEPSSGCDPSYCRGSQSECTQFGCISCYYSCSGDTCASQCSDPF